MADAFFVSINRFNAPTIMVLGAGEYGQDLEAVGEVLLLTPDNLPVFHRVVHVHRRGSLANLCSAARAIAHDELARRIREQPVEERPDTVAFDNADLSTIAGRRALGAYPRIEEAQGRARLEEVRALLQSFETISNARVFDS